MRALLKKYLPVSLVFAILPDFLQDFLKYIQHSGVFRRERDKTKMLGSIIATYHVIEKGLTMPETRLGFGRDVMLLLIEECLLFARIYGKDDQQLQHAFRVIAEYQEFHVNCGYNLDEGLLTKINEVMSLNRSVEPSVQTHVSREEYFRSVMSNYEEFSQSRRSVRNYSSERLSDKRVYDAIALARNSPSSCNRQTTRVYVFDDPDKVQRILQLQGGNRGFGHLADRVLVVVGELRLCFGVHEKNLVYVDGGMYVMSLLYSLHFQKIVACPLNCYFSKTIERKVRQECGIKDSEVVLAMISCGNAPDSFRLASSPRKGMDFYQVKE
jgi:nitroreductase